MQMHIEFPGGNRVDARVGDLVISTDQDGSAPPPFTLFLASIATCAGFYILNFCTHRGLSTDGIRIVQRTRTNHETHMVEVVEIDIEVPPEFPQKYHQALIRAADQCAVKRHLADPPEFAVRTLVGV